VVDLEGHTVRLYDHDARRWDTTTFEPSYDQMYLDELEHFFACVEGREHPRVDLHAGYRVQRIIDACARSSATGRWMAVA
jgi:predicted dehydrogenase